MASKYELVATGGGFKVAQQVSGQGRVETLVLQAVKVPLTAAQIIGMYAAPVLVVPGVTGKSIYIHRVIFDITRTATAFTGGGVVNVQYDSTVNGAGTSTHADISAATVTGAAGKTHTNKIPLVQDNIAAASIEGKGLYISNKTAAFAAGTGTATVTVFYHVI